MSTSSSRRHRLLASVLVAVAVSLGACGTDAETANPSLAIDVASENAELAWSMAADELGDAIDYDGEVVIVPSDDALLGLDADALADLVSTRRLGGMISDSVIRAGFTDDVRPGDVYILSDGTSVNVTDVDGRVLLNDVELIEITSIGDATLLIVDGIVVEP